MATILIQRNEYGEYEVPDGRDTYFAADLADAVETARNIHGGSVRIKAARFNCKDTEPFDEMTGPMVSSDDSVTIVSGTVYGMGGSALYVYPANDNGDCIVQTDGHDLIWRTDSLDTSAAVVKKDKPLLVVSSESHTHYVLYDPNWNIAHCIEPDSDNVSTVECDDVDGAVALFLSRTAW